LPLETSMRGKIAHPTVHPRPTPSRHRQNTEGLRPDRDVVQNKRCVLALAQPIGFWDQSEWCLRSINRRDCTQIQTHCGEEPKVRGRGVVFGRRKEFG
uniref:Uncharacterized protein n=1 Tax=Oncorhynchus mykiss TaxID=8022 RepID=A0A8C7WBN1_ONCMY